jgi:KaiC/GvpD/RAD55 family RecA-like ATPase
MTFSFSLPDDKKLYLVMSAANNLKTSNIEILRNLISHDHPVIVVTTNQPYATLVKNYQSNDLDLSHIFFIDAITKYATGKVTEGAINCRFINNPANLTDLGIAITETLNNIPDKKPCILFDSVSTMLIYIPSNNISKFIHFVTSKLRLMDSPGIFLAVDTGLDPLLLSQLTTFVDEIIDTALPEK